MLREMTAMRHESALRIIMQGLFVGGGSGLVIGTFRWLYDHGSTLMAHLGPAAASSAFGVAAFFAVLLFGALFSGWLVRREPLISGSGIPHVELVLNGKAEFPWLRVAVSKFIGTLVSLYGGLSVGREGPSIQMGAAVGCGFGGLFRKLSGESPANLPRFLISGSVAGMTAAFGAPLAGMFFAFEELRTIITVPMLLFTSASALAAWVMVDGVFGFGLVFPFSEIASLPLQQIYLAAAMGILSGLFGVFYNWFLMAVTYMHDRQKLVHPVLKPVLPFTAAGILFFAYPQVLSSVGYSMADIGGIGSAAIPLGGLCLLLTVKVIFSVLSFASGVPGGLLMPMLFIGGISGAVAGSFMGPFCGAHDLPVFLVLGMCGLFSGTVRAPLTGTVLVAEMCGSFQCLPEMLVTALIAAWTANRLRSRPIYKTLKVRMHKNLHAASGKAGQRLQKVR